MNPKRTHEIPLSAWPAAVEMTAQFLEHQERVDALLEGGSKRPVEALSGAERARCQRLVYGVIRHASRLEAVLGAYLARPPRVRVRALLLVAAYELWADGAESEAAAAAPGAAEGSTAKIVHHAVEQAKRLLSVPEARLVNAVLRRAAPTLAAQRRQPAPPAGAPAGELAAWSSHPAWWVERWSAQFGPAATRSLLEWNQTPAPVLARWRSKEAKPPEWLEPTPWPAFFRVPSGRWSDAEALVRAGQLYVQDPLASLSVELLAPARGETVLDLCAAPGGKSLFLADLLGEGRVVSVDLPGTRLGRLKENLTRAPAGVEVALVPADVRKLGAKLLRDQNLPSDYTAVLIDVPCSNTGVMRHRVDVKWRLRAEDFARLAREQLALLKAAALFVSPGGRLVYATCSLEPEENEKVVEAFLRESRGVFTFERQTLAYPWQNGHDGGGAFLLRKAAAAPAE